MYPFEAYHGRTAAQHQRAFDRLSRAGFRPIDLSAYGGAAHTRYNATWVQRPGPGFQSFHGVRAADYQERFNEAVASGMAPVLVAATGSGPDAIMAAVFEADVIGDVRARHGLRRTDFEAEDDDARTAGLALRSVAVYGTAGDPRYAAIWHTPPEPVITHLRAHDALQAYQGTFDAETALPFFRPRVLSVAEDGSIASVFSNDVVGRCTAYHGLTAADYQRVFDRHFAEGLMPISVDAGGVGSGVRFAAIFAERDLPLARQWSASGTGPALLGGVEQVVERFMRARSVRSAQLTILRNGRLQLERAYTWSEPGTRRTRVNDRMLLASCSKIFVAAAIQWLYDHERIVSRRPLRRRPWLTANRRVYPLLGFSGPQDARSDQITVDQLIAHRAGYPNKPDPTYEMRAIARDLQLQRPPTAMEIAQRIYKTRTLARAPGTSPEYANFGYLVATLVVEQVAGMSFLDFVRQRILAPLGVTDVAACPTAGPQAWPGNLVMPEDDGLGLTTLNPDRQTMVPEVFGGDQMAKESALGSCGLASSATALARVIHRHAVYGIGARRVDRRFGSTPGAQSAAVSRADGVDWVLIFNTRRGFTEAEWSAFIDAIDRALDAWPVGLRRTGVGSLERPAARGTPATSAAKARRRLHRS